MVPNVDDNTNCVEGAKDEELVVAISLVCSSGKATRIVIKDS